MEQQVLKMKESFWCLPQHVTRDGDFLSAFTAGSVWELLFAFLFFLKMTYENFSSLYESTGYHVPCTSAINPHDRQGHPACCSFIAFALFLHQFCRKFIFVKSPSFSNKFLICSRLLQWIPNWRFEIYFPLVPLQTLQF